MSEATKILSENPTEFELKVAQAFVDLEAQPDLRNELKPLKFLSIREIPVVGDKKAVVAFIPFSMLQSFRKVQIRLIRELEKKFSDRYFIFLAQRKILHKLSRKSRTKQKRPRSRTLTNVHDKILEDLVFPTEIVGKRIKFLKENKQIFNVMLNSKNSSSVDYKLNIFLQVYMKLTGKNVNFEIPSDFH